VPNKQSPPFDPSVTHEQSPPTANVSIETPAGSDEAATAAVVPMDTARLDLDALSLRERPSKPETAAELEAVYERVRVAAEAALGVKAEDVKILAMHELVSYTDYLLLCTGRNVRLTKRIAEDIAFKLKQDAGIVPTGIEGTGGNEWILMDYLDFIVHVFTPEARAFYRLDVLWKQAFVEVVE
jgi:ribosome-associated protein